MAAASNLAGYALHRVLGEDARFSLRGLVSDTLAGGLAEGVLGPAMTLNGTAVGGNIASSASFSWTAVAAAATKSVLRQGISYGVHQAIEGHATWNNGQVLGNAITDAAVAAAGMTRADEQRAKEAQQFYETAMADGNPFNDGVRQPLDAEQSASRLDGLRTIEDKLNAAGRASTTVQDANGAVAVGADGQYIFDPNLWDLDPNGKAYPVPKYDWVIDPAQYDPALATAGYDALYSNSLRYAVDQAERGSAIPFEFPGMDASPNALLQYNQDVQWWVYQRSENQPSGNQGGTFALKAFAGGAYSMLKAVPEAISGLYETATQPGRDLQNMYLYLGTEGRYGSSPESIQKRQAQTITGVQNALSNPIPNIVKPWYDTTMAAYDRGDGFTYGMRVTDASIAAVSLFAGGELTLGGKAGMVSREVTGLDGIAVNEFKTTPYYVVRGDSRGPEIIFNEGVKARGVSDDLYLHALDNTNPPSMYVSTSMSEDVAIKFGTKYFTEDGFYYTIRPSSDALDVNQILGIRSPYVDEMEIAIPVSVPPRDIRAVTPLNRDGTYLGYSILNPNWLP
jgi:hypothetical protein